MDNGRQRRALLHHGGRDGFNLDHIRVPDNDSAPGGSGKFLSNFLRAIISLQIEHNEAPSAQGIGIGNLDDDWTRELPSGHAASLSQPAEYCLSATEPNSADQMAA